MSIHRLSAAVIMRSSLLACLALSAAAQESYVFTKVVDSATQRPDGGGAFSVNAITTPAFDGQWVVFRDNGPVDDISRVSIWSYNLADGKLRKLVSRDTPAPGGSGTFSNFDLTNTAPTVRSGTVVFLAHDSSLGANNQGLYSVPAGGGAVSKIADYNSDNPSGGRFAIFDAAGKQIGGFSFDGRTVAFNAQGTASTLGNYTSGPDGSSLAATADNLHPYTASAGRVALFSAPVISGSNVVMAGTDSSTAPSYYGLYLGMAGGGPLVELVNSGQPLPGYSRAGARIRFDAPVIGFNGALAAFRASDTTAVGPFFGLYWTDLPSHAVNRVADINSKLPGLGALLGLADRGVAVSQGNILFRAADTAAQSALYLWNNGAAARVLGSGDTLGGQPVQKVMDPGPGALYGLGFAANVALGASGSTAIYVATRAPASPPVVTVMDAASYSTSAVSPGEIVTLFGAGLGPSTPATFTLDANHNVPNSLAGVQVFFNSIAAPLLYVSDAQSSALVPFEVSGHSTVQVTVSYNGKTSAPVAIPVVNATPGLFSSDASGSGAGAIQNVDAAGNFTLNTPGNPAAPGSAIVLWASGLGQLQPAPASGSVVGTNLPLLTNPVSVTIGGQAAQVLYAGPAPMSVAGLYQIDCQVPAGLPSGPAQVVVSSGGRSSQPNLTVSIK